MARTILIADDSPTIRKIVELTFSDTEIRVECARSGAEALERLAALRADLVLADVVMPEPNGYELCRSIKSSENPVPVLLLAGTFEPFDAQRARECGADAHLVKPFESDVLRARVRALLEAPAARPPADASDAEEQRPVEVAAEQTESVLPVAEAPQPPAAGPAIGLDPHPGVTPELVEAVAAAVVRRLSPDVLREVAARIVPELAAEIIRERIRELEQEELEEEGGRG